MSSPAWHPIPSLLWGGSALDGKTPEAEASSVRIPAPHLAVLAKAGLVLDMEASCPVLTCQRCWGEELAKDCVRIQLSQESLPLSGKGFWVLNGEHFQ